MSRMLETKIGTIYNILTRGLTLTGSSYYSLQRPPSSVEEETAGEREDAHCGFKQSERSGERTGSQVLLQGG